MEGGASPEYFDTPSYILTTPVFVITINENFRLEKPGLKLERGGHSNPTQPPIQSAPGSLSREQGALAVKLTTHLHPAWSLGVSGAISPLPLYFIMVRIGQNFIFNTSVRTQKEGMRFHI
jgi:hypothetical protein